MCKKIMEYTDEENWKDFIIDVFCGLPNIDLGIAEWISQLTNLYIDVLQKYNFQIAEGTNIKDIFKNVNKYISVFSIKYTVFNNRKSPQIN